MKEPTTKQWATIIGVPALVLWGVMSCTPAKSQDTPERPKPLTATVVGVCEHHNPAIMVVIFTYPTGKVLVVDGQHMQGFKSPQELIQYAATAETTNSYAQTCGDTSA